MNISDLNKFCELSLLLEKEKEIPSIEKEIDRIEKMFLKGTGQCHYHNKKLIELELKWWEIKNINKEDIQKEIEYLKKEPKILYVASIINAYNK